MAGHRSRHTPGKDGHALPHTPPLPTLEDRIVAHLSLSPATRSQLCEALDTSRTNLGRALATLLDEGSVVPIRSNAPGRGRPTQLLTLNASAAHAVGLSHTHILRRRHAQPLRHRPGRRPHRLPHIPDALECLEQTCEDADRERAPHRGGATASPVVGVCAGGEPS